MTGTTTSDAAPNHSSYASALSARNGKSAPVISVALPTRLTDRQVEAAEAADRALLQSEEWGFRAYADWLGERRRLLGS